MRFNRFGSPAETLSPESLHRHSEPGTIDYEEDVLIGTPPADIIGSGHSEEQIRAWEDHLATTPRELPPKKSYSQHNFWD